MWLFLPFGFFSIVSKAPEKPLHFTYSADNHICIRARDKNDLVNLTNKVLFHIHKAQISDIVTDEGTDYQARLWMNRKDFSHFMSIYIETTQISNFKNEVKSPKHKDVFSSVWRILWKLVR